MITKKQKSVLDYIKQYSKKNMYAPSLEEIQEHFGLASVSTAHYYINKLVETGYLERESNQPRGIAVRSAEFIEKIVPKHVEALAIPVLGSANAGTATIFAEENVEGYVKVSRKILNRKDGIFALRVEGDSMNNAKIDGKKIENGDFVLIDSEYKTPKNGDYVVSIIDGVANLKKFEREKNGAIQLIPESTNSKHKPIFISSEDDFIVNGRIIGVVKR
jgi:repressor LexA